MDIHIAWWGFVLIGMILGALLALGLVAFINTRYGHG